MNADEILAESGLRFEKKTSNHPDVAITSYAIFPLEHERNWITLTNSFVGGSWLIIIHTLCDTTELPMVLKALDVIRQIVAAPEV